ncbi:PREDICTED: putative F-box protein At1g67623 [Lupinus angustifolius]|nr:PREDICTED: putative F-box protein At1g67623 [Lupinus angustifolius]
MDILYREGLLQYLRVNIGGGGCGVELLKIVAEKGHKEAKYVYGMIMLCSENEELRKHGLKHMRFLRESMCVIRCRKNVEKILQYVWKNNKKLVQNQINLCKSKNTCKSWRPKQGRWSLLDDDDDDNNDVNMCEYCRWDHELVSFSKFFHVH